MVVFYNNDDKNIKDVVMVEHDVMSPTIPGNRDLSEKISYYSENDMSYISLPYELGGDIFSYKLCFNNSKEFVGLTPIGNE